MRTLILTAFVLTLAATAGAGEAPAKNPVEETLRNPPATGLLVRSVSDGSQAHRQGILPGDVILSYGGTPVASVKALAERKEAVADQAEAVPCVLQRGAKRITVQLQPGALGVSLAPVEKGKPAEPLPKATLNALDYAKLAAKPRHAWYRFTLDGKTQVGFEHGHLDRPNGGVVVALTHEVGFDGGERWGVTHHRVSLAAIATKDRFQVTSTEYVNLRGGWKGTGRLVRPKEGASYWEATWPPVDGKPIVKKVALPPGLPVFPSYLVSALVELMPRKKGACLHYRPLNEGMGTVGLPSALHVAGQETIEHDGAQVPTWKIELRALGGTTSTTWWVDASGHVLRIDYGGARTHASTPERVLAGVPDTIQPGQVAPQR